MAQSARVGDRRLGHVGFHGPRAVGPLLRAVGQKATTPAARPCSPTSTRSPCRFPDFTKFACYNTQLEKARIDAAGYMRCGPPRPPYTDLPDEWRQAAETNGRAWADLCTRYREEAR